MRLKKTVAVALATALLATTAAVPAFAADTTNKITVKANADADGTYSKYLDDSTTADSTFDSTKDTSTGTTEVIYKVTETYTWSIPKTIDFGADAGVNKSVVGLSEDKITQNSETNATIYRDKNEDSVVKVTKNVIPAGMALTIKVDGGEHCDSVRGVRYLILENNESTKLRYQILKRDSNFPTSADEFGVNSVVLTVNSGTNSGSQPLVFKLYTRDKSNVDDSEFAGKYKDTLTFTATVENQTNG